MKTKKVLNIKPQEVCEGGEHYVRYKGCDGRMHELPTHTVTHNERVKEMFITSIDTLHSVIMSAELTNPEARAVFQASFPNAIEVKDIQVAGCFLRDDSQQSELRFDAPSSACRRNGSRTTTPSTARAPSASSVTASLLTSQA